METSNHVQQEVVYLGSGCFWCTEAVFKRVQGVLSVESGYANGHVPNPSYEQVSSGQTGHAEVVKVVFDAAQIPLSALLEIFFGTHDPTTPNRQGNDVGPQYRSGVYTTSVAQQAVAQSMVEQIHHANLFGAPVVTEVQPLDAYYPAENYHQDYFARNPQQGYCAFVVGPKVEKFMKTFAAYAKKD